MSKQAFITDVDQLLQTLEKELPPSTTQQEEYAAAAKIAALRDNPSQARKNSESLVV